MKPKGVIMIWRVKHKNKYEWERWFAWTPVVIGTEEHNYIDEDQVAWLVWVERKWMMHRNSCDLVYRIPAPIKSS
jgi:hypothetical protein